MPSQESAHILLAEDNPADQRPIAEALNINDLSHELHIVDNGEEAARVVRVVGTEGQAPCPDLLILEPRVAQGGRLGSTARISSNEHCTDTPVIVFTASLSPADRVAAERFAGVRFISRPIDLEEFLELGRSVKHLLFRAIAK